MASVDDVSVQKLCKMGDKCKHSQGPLLDKHQFNKNKRFSDGLWIYCRQCQAEMNRAQYRRNQEKRIQYAHDYQKAHKDEIKTRKHGYYKSHEEEIKSKAAEWRQNHLEHAQLRDRQYA